MGLKVYQREPFASFPFQAAGRFLLGPKLPARLVHVIPGLAVIQNVEPLLFIVRIRP